jgi:Concanavalin A-like lectin/glucanases superfamily
LSRVGPRCWPLLAALLLSTSCRYHLLGSVELDAGTTLTAAPADGEADRAPLPPADAAAAGADAGRADVTPDAAGADAASDVGADTAVPRDLGRDLAADLGPRRCVDPDLPRLIVYYSFDDCTDPPPAKLNDMAVPGPADATRGPGTRCQPGRHGHALYFDGAPGAEVVVPERVSFKTTRMTLSVWVRPWRSRAAAVIGRWYYFDAFLLEYRPREDGTGADYLFSIGLPLAGTELGETVLVGASAEEDTWTHLAGTFDGNQVRLYKNGSLFSEQKVANGPRDMQDARRSLTMGALLKGPLIAEGRFHGQLDEVRLYGVALTPKQVTHLATCNP